MNTATEPQPEFVTTERTHDDCSICNEAVDAAIGTAKATGSTGATWIEDRAQGRHSATVTRAQPSEEQNA